MLTNRLHDRCIVDKNLQFSTMYLVFEVLNGSDHLDMCILKLSNLAFQDDNFLFYLLLVYVNNCRKKYILPHLFLFLILPII